MTPEKRAEKLVNDACERDSADPYNGPYEEEIAAAIREARNESRVEERQRLETKVRDLIKSGTYPPNTWSDVYEQIFGEPPDLSKEMEKADQDEKMYAQMRDIIGLSAEEHEEPACCGLCRYFSPGLGCGPGVCRILTPEQAESSWHSGRAMVTRVKHNDSCPEYRPAEETP